MAHSCPECGQMCHCGGDIDDIDFGEDSAQADRCIHSEQETCDANLPDEPIDYGDD